MSLLLGGHVIACSCVESTVKEAWKNSDVVFSGTVIGSEIVQVAFKDDPKRTRAIMRYTINVEEFVKGASKAKTLVIFTTIDGAECGIALVVGRGYVIHAYRSCDRPQLSCPEGPNYFWTDLCTRTRSFDEAEMKALKSLR